MPVGASVKAVFEKFGVSSRGELVARLFGEHYADPMHATMRLLGTDGFFEVRLAQDGTAHVFAIDT